MKFEKITENKIKIFLSLSDLQKENIDYHSFMSNSPSAQNLFLNILNEASLKLNFDTNNCKLLIETLSVSNEIFIFTITKQKISTLSKKKLVAVKRKYPLITSNYCIYRFSLLDDFIDFCQGLKNLKFSASALYFYNNFYYFYVDTVNIEEKQLNFFYNYISEFANFIEPDSFFNSKILEYGECILTSAALNNFYNTRS